MGKLGLEEMLGFVSWFGMECIEKIIQTFWIWIVLNISDEFNSRFMNLHRASLYDEKEHEF